MIRPLILDDILKCRVVKIIKFYELINSELVAIEKILLSTYENHFFLIYPILCFYITVLQ